MPGINTSIVLTVISEDRPGIVQKVSGVLRKHGGNWTQSSMSSLAGQFAGILLASVPSDRVDDCLSELRELENAGLHVIAQASGEIAAPDARPFELELVGNDRPGIVHDITAILERHGVNVQELETRVEAASMGGADLFRARARLMVPESTRIEALETDIEGLANDLMVEIHFRH